MKREPPRLARSIAILLAARNIREELVGDLEEEFQLRADTDGIGHARGWYRGQVLKSIPHLLSVRARAARARAYSRKGEGFVGTFAQDVRYAFRGMVSNPLFSLAVVVTLALGIGANTTIYSVVDGLVFNPYPFPQPETLVDVGSEYPRLGRPLTFVEHLSPAEYEDIRDQTSSLTDVVAWDMGNRQVATQESATNLFTGFWWGDGFTALRVSPHLGRGFLPEEIEQGARVAIVSHRYWANQMGSDPSAIGRVLEINAAPYELVGVMPPETLLYGMDLWIPMSVGPSVFPRNRRQFQVIGRVADGASMDQVATELEGLARRIELEHGAEFPEYQGFRLTPATWTEANVQQFKTAALVLIGAVLAVLLIVCANVANLLLSRSNTRRREVAVRTALGASRGRVLRQLLTESLILALTGAAAGIGLAWFGVRFVDGIVAQIPFVDGNVLLNTRSLAYTAAVAAVAGVAFGLAPTLHTLKADVRSTLVAHGSGTTGGRSRNRAQRWLVGAEVAVAVLLLFGGGLLVNSMIRLNRADPGFDHRNVLTMRLTLPWEEYSGDDIALFFETLAERVRAIPGVRDATVGSQYPPIVFAQSQLVLEGQEAVSEGGPAHRLCDTDRRRILRDSRGPAPGRTYAGPPGPIGYAPGGRHQLGLPRPVHGRRGSDRTDRPGGGRRRHIRRDRGCGGGNGKPGVLGGAPAGDLRIRAPALRHQQPALPADTGRRRTSKPCPAGENRRGGAGLGPTRVCDRDHGGSVRGAHVGPVLCHNLPGLVRPVRAAAVGSGNLWGRCVRRSPTPTGDRAPHGPGSIRSEGARPGGATDPVTGPAGRPGRGIERRIPRTRPGGPALRSGGA